MLLVRGWILCSGCWEGDGGEMEERAAVESGKEEGEQSGAADKQSSTQHTQTPTTATLIHIHSLPTTSQLSPITHQVLPRLLPNPVHPRCLLQFGPARTRPPRRRSRQRSLSQIACLFLSQFSIFRHAYCFEKRHNKHSIFRLGQFLCHRIRDPSVTASGATLIGDVMG